LSALNVQNTVKLILGLKRNNPSFHASRLLSISRQLPASVTSRARLCTKYKNMRSQFTQSDDTESVRGMSAVSKEDLLRQIIQLGSSSSELAVSTSNETDLVIERKIVDAEYYKVVGKEGLKVTYKAYLLLDEGRLEARYYEIITSVARSAGIFPTPSLHVEKEFVKGKTLFKKEIGKAWGWKKPGPRSFGKVYDYEFDFRKIREPIKSLIEQSGWKFTQVLQKSNATYNISTAQPLGSTSSQGFCTCGAPVLSGHNFCMKCGAKISCRP